MVTVLAPLAYVAFLVGSLVVFSKVYRRRQAAKAISEPWFPAHTARDLYVSLLSMDPPPERPVLIAALIRRAMTDVQRLMEVRTAKMAMQTLLQKGQIGDDTWNHLLETEKELEAELMEVVGEANTFKQGWGQIIFAHASDMVQHEKHQKIYHSIEAERQKARAFYAAAKPAYVAPPIVGIASGNPKKRVLPENLQNAQVPGSKPATPQPPRQVAPPQQQQQPSQQPQQQQQAILTPTKAAAGKGASTPPRSSPAAPKVEEANTPNKGTASATPAPAMQRNDTNISTASTALTGDGESSEDEAAGEEEAQTSATSTPAGANGATGKKTPKKTPKKKKGKKK